MKRHLALNGALPSFSYADDGRSSTLHYTALKLLENNNVFTVYSFLSDQKSDETDDATSTNALSLAKKPASIFDRFQKLINHINMLMQYNISSYPWPSVATSIIPIAYRLLLLYLTRVKSSKDLLITNERQVSLMDDLVFIAFAQSDLTWVTAQELEDKDEKSEQSDLLFYFLHRKGFRLCRNFNTEKIPYQLMQRRHLIYFAFMVSFRGDVLLLYFHYDSFLQVIEDFIQQPPKDISLNKFIQWCIELLFAFNYFTAKDRLYFLAKFTLSSNDFFATPEKPSIWDHLPLGPSESPDVSFFQKYHQFFLSFYNKQQKENVSAEFYFLPNNLHFHGLDLPCILIYV